MGIYLNPENDGLRYIVNGLYVDKTGLLGYINGVIGTSRATPHNSRLKP